MLPQVQRLSGLDASFLYNETPAQHVHTLKYAVLDVSGRVNAFRARAWWQGVLAAGLDGLRIDDLRHTAVALWIAAGGNPKEVSVRAGHASVSFTPGPLRP